MLIPIKVKCQYKFSICQFGVDIKPMKKWIFSIAELHNGEERKTDEELDEEPSSWRREYDEERVQGKCFPPSTSPSALPPWLHRPYKSITVEPPPMAGVAPTPPLPERERETNGGESTCGEEIRFLLQWNPRNKHSALGDCVTREGAILLEKTLN